MARLTVMGLNKALRDKGISAKVGHYRETPAEKEERLCTIGHLRFDFKNAYNMVPKYIVYFDDGGTYKCPSLRSAYEALKYRYGI